MFFSNFNPFVHSLLTGKHCFMNEHKIAGRGNMLLV